MNTNDKEENDWLKPIADYKSGPVNTTGQVVHKLSCPRCGNDQAIDVRGDAIIRIMPSANQVTGTLGWEDDSTCSCPMCDWIGVFNQLAGYIPEPPPN